MEPPKPSAYIPFFRRFTNERAQELEETRRLYQWVKARQDSYAETHVTIGKRLYAKYPYTTKELDDEILQVILFLLDEIAPFKPLPEPNFERMNLEEFVSYRNLLYEKQYFFQNPHLDLVEEAITYLLEFITDLPELATPSPFTIPLYSAYPDLGETIRKIMSVFGHAPYQDRGIFKALSEALWQNIVKASPSEKRIIAPQDSNLKGEALVSAYLGGTVFERLMLFPIPLKLTIEQMFSHVHLLGGSGAGKSVTIERLVLHFLALDDPPSIVVIEPHSDLVRKLARADLGIEPIIIDPRDIHHPPALNIFATSGRLSDYDDVTREQVFAGAIETFLNLFQNLGIPLTGKQDVFFRACIRMLLSLPEVEGRNATIKDLLNLMIDPAPYQAAIDRLPELQREFFARDFMSKTFDQTREQIRYRLQAIISEPTMERMFCCPESKLDFFTELNRGSLILIDGAKDFLKTEGSANFSRLMVSLIMKAVLERATIPERERKPVLLFIDEAASCFSRDISSMLEEVRKYKTSVTLAHQALSQCSSALAASIHANTSTKLASGVSAADASAMAREMRCDADFILDQPRLQFAAYIRNVTPHAVTIPVRPAGQLPSLSDEAWAARIERNRERVAMPAPPQSTSQETAPPSTGAEPDEDISAEW